MNASNGWSLLTVLFAVKGQPSIVGRNGRPHHIPSGVAESHHLPRGCDGNREFLLLLVLESSVRPAPEAHGPPGDFGHALEAERPLHENLRRVVVAKHRNVAVIRHVYFLTFKKTLCDGERLIPIYPEVDGGF